MTSGPAPAKRRSSARSRDELVIGAAAELLKPLASLMLAGGVKYGPVAEMLKHVLVDTARRSIPGGAEARATSRISVATGIHRKDVKRLIGSKGLEVADGDWSVASEAFTRWLTDPRFQDESGAPRVLNRQVDPDSPASFEFLAREVSRDVHPRTILEELVRLNMVELEDDAVRVIAQAFVPAAGEEEMMRFLADNVRDHFSAAVSNVTGRSDNYLEQAIFADELSAESVDEIEAIAREHWQKLLRELVPRIQQMVDRDRQAAGAADRRARIGMYSFSAGMDSEAPSAVRGDKQ